MPEPTNTPGAEGGNDDPNKGGATPPEGGSGGNSGGSAGQSKGNEPEGKGDSGGSVDPDKLGFSDAQKAYIKSLRDESAGYRNKAKQLETEVGSVKGTMKKIGEALGFKDEKEPTKEDIDRLAQENNDANTRLAIRDAAFDLGIVGRDGLEYFEFLVQKKMDSLKDGEELDLQSEDVKTLAKKAMQLHGGGSKSTSPGSGNGDGGNGNPNPDNGSGGQVTVEKFAGMTTSEKSELFNKNPDLYNRLMGEARDKRVLI